jgi:peptidoglycan/LPS O-acetylase OafA/YrhL
MWVADVEHPSQTVFADRPAFAALVSLHDRLKPTPLFRAGAWLLVCVIVCGFGWRRRGTPEGAFALGTCGSAAVYVLTFFAVGVASDFRYAYWAVLAGIAGCVVAASGRPGPEAP